MFILKDADSNKSKETEKKNLKKIIEVVGLVAVFQIMSRMINK
jgi:hypothetical protein